MNDDRDVTNMNTISQHRLGEILRFAVKEIANETDMHVSETDGLYTDFEEAAQTLLGHKIIYVEEDNA